MGMSALDYEEIRQLLARYNMAIDGGDAAGWAACFTKDGTFESSGLPDGHPFAGRFEGSAALTAFAAKSFEMTKGRGRHWNNSVAIEGDGETATMRCYLLAFTAGAPGTMSGVSGIYEDRLVKRDGRWLFAERHATTDG
jgi:uncharacterized protein (TIGR02246 family)